MTCSLLDAAGGGGRGALPERPKERRAEKHRLRRHHARSHQHRQGTRADAKKTHLPRGSSSVVTAFFFFFSFPFFSHQRLQSHRLLWRHPHEQHHRRGDGGAGLRQGRDSGAEARRRAQRGDGGAPPGTPLFLTFLPVTLLGDSTPICPPPPFPSVPYSTPPSAVSGASAYTT